MDMLQTHPTSKLLWGEKDAAALQAMLDRGNGECQVAPVDIRALTKKEAGYFVGLYLGEELVGLCTLGYDDDAEDCRTGLLSEVYIRQDIRQRDFGKQLVKAALQAAMNTWHFNKVNIDLLDAGLFSWYTAMGFGVRPEFADDPTESMYHLSWDATPKTMAGGDGGVARFTLPQEELGIATFQPATCH